MHCEVEKAEKDYSVPVCVFSCVRIYMRGEFCACVCKCARVLLGVYCFQSVLGLHVCARAYMRGPICLYVSMHARLRWCIIVSVTVCIYLRVCRYARKSTCVLVRTWRGMCVSCFVSARPCACECMFLRVIANVCGRTFACVCTTFCDRRRLSVSCSSISSIKALFDLRRNETGGRYL